MSRQTVISLQSFRTVEAELDIDQAGAWVETTVEVPKEGLFWRVRAILTGGTATEIDLFVATEAGTGGSGKAVKLRYDDVPISTEDLDSEEEIYYSLGELGGVGDLYVGIYADQTCTLDLVLDIQAAG